MTDARNGGRTLVIESLLALSTLIVVAGIVVTGVVLGQLKVADMAQDISILRAQNETHARLLAEQGRDMLGFRQHVAEGHHRATSERFLRNEARMDLNDARISGLHEEVRRIRTIISPLERALSPPSHPPNAGG